MKIIKHGIAERSKTTIETIKIDLQLQCEECHCEFVLQPGDRFYLKRAVQKGCFGAGYALATAKCPECAADVEMTRSADFLVDEKMKTKRG